MDRNDAKLILQKIEHLEQIFEGRFTTLEEKIEQNRKYLESHNNILKGNGGEGILTRVAKLEDKERTIASTVKLVVGTIFALVAKSLWDILRRF